MSNIAKNLSGSLVALLLCAGQAGLLAADTFAAEPQHSVTLHNADLNLNRPADVAKLYHRITVAARGVCVARSQAGSLQVLPADQRCLSEVVTQAVGRVDQPTLSAYHRQQSGLTCRRDSSIAQGGTGS